MLSLTWLARSHSIRRSQLLANNLKCVIRPYSVKKTKSPKTASSEAAPPPPKPRWDPAATPFGETSIESGWQDYWESRRIFEPAKNDPRPHIRMLLPPPNVTGQLHIGHALMISIQDALARWYRMSGNNVHWAPGTDHAGIATQSVVEKMLFQERGLRRTDMKREDFVAEVEAWREKYGNRILEQMRTLGASTTTSEMYYTRDPTRTKVVNNAFVKLYEEGLIYRSTRMVNWCPKLSTAVSDVETVVQEFAAPNKMDGVEFGVLHKFAYKLVDEEGEIVVATTRPETIPGDRAIAVHPDDLRYKHLHYKYAQHPLLPNVQVPIVPDAELVDPEFGTGAVKITPAHDANDYEFWKRHSVHYVDGKGEFKMQQEPPKAQKKKKSKGKKQIKEAAKEETAEASKVDAAVETAPAEQTPKEGTEAPAGSVETPVEVTIDQVAHPERRAYKKIDIPLVQVIGRYGEMLRECEIPSLVGRDRLKCRHSVVKLLKEAGAYRGNEPNPVRINICERTGAVIEPMLQPQWYLSMKPLAKKVMEVAGRDGLTFVPSSPHKKLWDQWLDGIQDWCLSRQIWWGHRIPAYQIVDPYRENKVVRWIAAATYDEAERKMTLEERKAGCIPIQDQDVLDTWFSSGLLPLSTAGITLKGNSPTTSEAYPLEFIESGSDILFFWLARMAMLSTWFTGKLPYNEIILHPLVCDAHGRKMSKSVGNVIDPLLIVHGRTHLQLVEDVRAEFANRIEQRGDAGVNAASEMRQRLAALRKNFPKGFQASGADSLRMALVDYTRRYTKINMEMAMVDHFRKFLLKLQNAFKFYTMQREAIHGTLPPLLRLHDIPYKELTPHDKLLLHRLRHTIATVNTAFTTRELYRATTTLHDFVKETFSALYMEFVKKELLPDAPSARRRHVVFSILTETWDIILRLLHPLIPFHTETLWQEIHPEQRALVDGVSIATQAYPQVADVPEYPAAAHKDIHLALSLIDALRDYGRGRRGNVPITHLPFKIALPYTPEGEYIRNIFATVKMVTRSKGAEVLEEGELVDGLRGYSVVWRASDGGEEAEQGAMEPTERRWTCWEKVDGGEGERVFVYDVELESSGLGEMRGLVHSLSQTIPEPEEK